MMKKKSAYRAKNIISQTPALKNSMDFYIKEVAKYPVLSKEEELRLAQKFYKTKDINIARILAQSNLKFVVKIAMTYTQFGAQLIDLVQEGNIGLLQAIKQFNPYKGVRLITYAVWWIRGYIQEYLMRQYSLVRIGTTAQQRKLFYLLKKQQQQLKQLHYQDDDMKLLTYEKFPEKDVQMMQQRLSGKDISLDQPLSKNGDTLLVDMQTDHKEPSLEEQFNLSQEKHIITQSIQSLRSQLNEKELFILDRRLLSNQPFTLQQIGQKYSVTREYIRQIENRLIQKIKAAIQRETSTANKSNP